MNQALTIGIDEETFGFLGSLEFRVLDCAGQDQNMQDYLT